MIGFVCNQSIHVMRAVQLHLYVDEFKEEADIYIGSSFYDSKNIAERLKKEKIFNRVIWIDDNTMIPKKAGVIKLLYGNSALTRQLKKERYKLLVNFNIESTVSTVLYNLNKNVRDFACYQIEDGPGLYNFNIPPNDKKMHLFHLIGIEKPIFHIDKWWFSEPEMMDIGVKNALKVKLPHIDYCDNEFKKCINRIYRYGMDITLEKADILIMEEPYYTDGRLTEKINDYKIFERIRDTFPEANILVKLHPRTKINRFKSNFQVMKNQGIPWEVYVLNMLSDGKELPIQIGIRCNTLQSDMLCFGTEGKKIVLARLFMNNKIKANSMGNYEIDDNAITMLSNIGKLYSNPDDFKIVYNEDEIISVLKEWMENKCK